MRLTEGEKLAFMISIGLIVLGAILVTFGIIGMMLC